MDSEKTTVTRKVKQVTLMACDDGLKMVFNAEADESTAVTLDWVQVAELSLRIDAFGKEALTMMQAGLDPYSSAHRHSFLVAEFMVASEKGGL